VIVELLLHSLTFFLSQALGLCGEAFLLSVRIDFLLKTDSG